MSELARQYAHAQAVKSRLWGAIPTVVKKVPSLTVVRPELIVKPGPNPEGRPRKFKLREEPNDHVFAFWVYKLQRKERRTALEHAKMVCFAARVPWELLTSRKRSQDLTKLRERISWQLRQRGLSFPQIGAIMNRDHTAIINSVRKFSASMGDREASKWIERKSRQANESHERNKAKESA